MAMAPMPEIACINAIALMRFGQVSIRLRLSGVCLATDDQIIEAGPWCHSVPCRTRHQWRSCQLNWNVNRNHIGYSHLRLSLARSEVGELALAWDFELCNTCPIDREIAVFQPLIRVIPMSSSYGKHNRPLFCVFRAPGVSGPNIVLRMFDILGKNADRRPFSSRHDGAGIIAGAQQT